MCFAGFGVFFCVPAFLSRLFDTGWVAWYDVSHGEHWGSNMRIAYLMHYVHFIDEDYPTGRGMQESVRWILEVENDSGLIMIHCNTTASGWEDGRPLCRNWEMI